MKDIEAIKEQLGQLKKVPNTGHFEWKIGKYIVKIFLDRIQEHTSPDDDCITDHSEMDVMLVELVKSEYHKDRRECELYVSLERDPRFSNYDPIKYVTYTMFSSKITYPGNGNAMPIDKVCELIYYLHRLSNLTAFL